MAYTSDITALSPSHLYTFDGDVLDSVGSANGTNSGAILTDSNIALDASNCMTTITVTDLVTLASAATIEGELHRKAVGG